MVGVESETLNEHAGIVFQATQGTTVGSSNSIAGTSGLITNDGGALTGDMAFYTNSGDNYAERMRIASDGDIGIGTAAPTGPASRKHVQITGAGTTGVGLIMGPATAVSNALVGSMSFYSGSTEIVRIETGTENSVNCDGAISFDTAKGGTVTRRMTINSSGSVGIGTTVPQGLVQIFSASAGTHTPNAIADQLVIEDNTNAGMTIVVPDNAYAQIVMGSPGADGSYCSNARLAGGYNSGNQRFDISVGGCDSAMTVYDTGCVNIGGVLSKGSGSFRIQHPLESRDGYDLVHSFTESPQADLLYSGWTKLTSGITTINIDTIHDMTEGTFVALNRCIRVFTSNESDWDMVRGSVTGNQLTIESNNSSSVACVSWLVIGERCDKHMFDTDWTDDNGRVIVEPETAPPLVIEE